MAPVAADGPPGIRGPAEREGAALAGRRRRDPVSGVRKQYHFRRSGRGLLAWDVDRLIELSAGFTPIDVPLSEIRELEETFWFGAERRADLPPGRPARQADE